MTTRTLEPPAAETAEGSAVQTGIWMVLPTYNEAENVEAITHRILTHVPDAHVLIVDDASPDGTGLIADAMAEHDDRIEVLHRAAKEGLGRAYLAGFAIALARGADVVVQLDADGSHDPVALPQLVSPILAGAADLVIGSRYAPGGQIIDWGWGRKAISRGGSLYARTVLGLPVRDLTGGFKAWRASTLRAIDASGVRAGGYVFQIEMTCRAFDAGARVREVPITFRDRRFGHSKMSRHIVSEAFLLVLRLGWERRMAERPSTAAAR
jgi:dolichol-phosphate mannosyltransferase